MNIQHLVFHPSLSTSRVNRQWAQRIRDSGKVAISRDMYAEHPGFTFDEEREQAELLTAGRVAWQFPFYWYSVPPLLKKYIDDVFTYGFAYGTEGTKLKGKELQLIVSVGGPNESYRPGGYNNFTVPEFLRPLQQTASLCGMTYLPPMWMHRSVAATEGEIAAQGDIWVRDLDDPERADPWALQRKITAEAVALA